MPIDTQHAEAMLKLDDCPFTREWFEECKKDSTKILFVWSGIDIFVSRMLEATTTKQAKVPRPSFNKK